MTLDNLICDTASYSRNMNYWILFKPWRLLLSGVDSSLKQGSGYLVLLMILVLDTAHADILTLSTCFNQPHRTLTLQCPAGHMIRVTKVREGHSESGVCGYTEGDCVFEVKDSTYPCVGRQRCDINLPSGDHGMYVHTCKLHTTYMEVSYVCVPAIEVVDICSTASPLTQQHGYISSPHYPHNYPSNLNCTVVVETSFPTQRLTLYAVELTLEIGDLGCKDMLHVFDGHRSYTTCSTVARQQVFSTMVDQNELSRLELTFSTDGSGRNKGFWLYYQVDTYMTSTTTPVPAETTTRTTTTTTESPHRQPHEGIDYIITSSQPVAMTTEGELPIDTTQPNRPFPLLGIVVGLILGAIVLSLVITLIVLLVRRWQYKKRHSCTCACNAAIMATDIAKATPPQTYNNLFQNVGSSDLSGAANTSHDQDFLTKAKAGNKNINVKEVEINLDYGKSGAFNKGAFIDTDKETGQDQLFC